MVTGAEIELHRRHMQRASLTSELCAHLPPANTLARANAVDHRHHHHRYPQRLRTKQASAIARV